jgi:benzoylformate decarboxylase
MADHRARHVLYIRERRPRLGLPASVGIALAERGSGRNRAVITIMGDRSTPYTIQSLWNETELRLPLLVVILRNAEYAILKSFAILERTPGFRASIYPGMDDVPTGRSLH